MKKYLLLLIIGAFLITGCGDGEKENIPEGTHKVEVKQSMNASNYTYMLVEENGDEYWIAVPQMSVKEGDVYYFSKSLEMQNFSSSSLNRTFERILFVEDIRGTEQNTGGMTDAMNPHSQVMSGKKDIKVDHLKDGQTVEEIYKNKQQYSGKDIKVKGVITKYNPGILDRNWIHIQDGTGHEKDFDLIVTSLDEVEEGATVVVSGKVVLNKDFGNGYAYEVLVENASVKSE